MRRNKWFLWAAIAGFLSLFLKVLFEVKADDWDVSRLLRLDRYILDSVAQMRTPTLNGMAVDITGLASTFVVTLLVLFLIVLFSLRRHWVDMLHIAVAGIFSATLGSFVKSLVQRERPPLEFRLVEVDHFSYPSGHATTSALIYLTIGLIFYERYHSSRERYFCLGSAILLIFLIGFSRIYLGVHYASDVAGGFSLGATIALFIYALRREYQSKLGLSN